LYAGEGEVIGCESVTDVDLKCGLLREVSYSMTTSACKRLVRKYCTDHWQKSGISRTQEDRHMK